MLHSISLTTPRGVPFALRPDDSMLIGAPRIHDTPYAVRLMLEVSGEHVAAIRRNDPNLTHGQIADMLWERYIVGMYPLP